jgi:outer membrane protein assembly factor BamE (lipoprotein component of BamABCDE complex)
MKTSRSLLLSALLLLPACALARQDTNEPLDAELIRSLQPGKTTARDVVERLGAPTEVVQLGRRTAYRYDASATKSTVLFLLLINFGNQDTRTDRLWVFFDENNILTHHGAWYGTHRPQYAMPWEDVHEASDNAEADAERPGVGK